MRWFDGLHTSLCLLRVTTTNPNYIKGKIKQITRNGNENGNGEWEWQATLLKHTKYKLHRWYSPNCSSVLPLLATVIEIRLQGTYICT